MATRSARSRAAIAAAALITVAFGAGACANSDDGAGSGEAETFTYWSMWKEGEEQQKVIATAIADYEKETGVKVEVQWQGRDNLKKLVPALNTNNVPDLVDGSYVNGYSSLAASNQARGLKDAYELKVDGKAVNELVPEKYLKSIDIKLKDGQPWMLPYQLQSDAIWFNAATHPDLKANPPKTWEEFVTVLDTLKAKGEAPIAADGDIGGYNAAWLATVVVQSSGPGAFKKIAEDPTGQAWKSPEVLDAATKVSQLAKGGYFIKGYDASKFPLQQQKWADNNAALIYMGTWLPVEASSYAAAGFEYGSFPFPSTNGTKSQRLDFAGWMMPKKAKNAEAAGKFATFFLGKKYQDAWGTEAKGLPLREDAATSPELAGVQASIKDADTYRQALDGVAFTGYNEKVFNPNSDKLFLGKSTPQEFVEAMASEQADYWKSQGK